MARPARWKEGKRLYKKIHDHVMKGVTYKTNLAAALGMTYNNWARMASMPGSQLDRVYEEAIAKRDAIVQRAYFDIVNDPNMNPRLKADFIKTEKLLIDKKHFDNKYLTPQNGFGNPAYHLSEQDLLAELQKNPPPRLVQQEEASTVVVDTGTVIDADFVEPEQQQEPSIIEDLANAE